MIEILKASMEHSKEDGYLGHVEFKVEGHEHPYEITLQSNEGKTTGAMRFTFYESGKEEDIEAVEEFLKKTSGLICL